MVIKRVLMDNNLFDPAVLRITPDIVRGKFALAGCNITALSLGSGYVIPSAAPHLIMHALKNLAAISFATEYSFPEAAALKAAAQEAEKEPEKEESEEEIDMGMDLFGRG